MVSQLLVCCRYAEAVYDKCGGYANCFGFIDGKDWKTCRPVRNQGVCYTGRKKIHGIKSQSLILPNGIIGHFYGPLVVSRHDSHLLSVSGLVAVLRHISSVVLQTAVPFAAYGDPAYPISEVLLRPFKGVNVMTPPQRELNKIMSSTRISVEWGFGRVQSNLPYLQHFSRLKLLQRGGCGVQKHVDAVLLTNLFTMMYGGLCPNYFKCHVGLSIEEYLA